MQTFIDTAQVYNKTLKISNYNVLLGAQQAQEARANLLPKITANADYRYFVDLPYQLLPLSVLNPSVPEGQFRAVQFGVPHNISANLQLLMPLYNPQLYGAIERAQRATDLRALQHQKTEEQVYFDISNLYYNAQILHHQLSFVDSNLVNARRLLANVTLRNEQLLATGTDVNKTKLQVAQLATQKENIRSQYEQVLNSLKFATGLALDQYVQIDPDIQYRDASEYAPVATLDMRIVEAQSRVLESELSTLQRPTYLPTLNLVGSYGATGFGYNGSPRAFLDFYPVSFAGIQVSYALFNGTITRRRIGQRNIELLSNKLQSGLATEQTALQVENARLQRVVARYSVQTTAEQIELAKSVYAQTIIQQKQGTAGLADVLLADNALREAQQMYLTAVIDFLKADLTLKKLTGNLRSEN